MIIYSSGIPTSSRSHRHPTAQRLLEVAIAAIDQGGESALRLDSVVEKAGVAITAVYHHFGNREGLMEAAQAERYIRTVWPLNLMLSERLTTVDSREELQVVLFDALAAATNPHFVLSRLRRVNVVGSTLGRPRLAAAISAEQLKANTFLADILRPFQEKGMLRAELDLEAFAGWVMGLVLSRVMVELEPGQPMGLRWDQITRQAVLNLLFDESN
jgi:AcrR family transcriptional regulator